MYSTNLYSNEQVMNKKAQAALSSEGKGLSELGAVGGF